MGNNSTNINKTGPGFKTRYASFLHDLRGYTRK